MMREEPVKRDPIEQQVPNLELLEQKPEPPEPTMLNAKELLAMMPEPIMEPTQRQYGEDFYPKYERFYNKIRAAAEK